MTTRRSTPSEATENRPEPFSRTGGGGRPPESQGHRPCQAVTTTGVPCSSPAQSGASFCYFHDPLRAAEQQDARREGGRQRQRLTAVLGAHTPPKRIQTVADVTELLSDTINQVRTGQLDPKVANCVGYLSGIMLKAIEVGENEERLAAMEAVVGRNPRTGYAGDFDRPLPGEDGEHDNDRNDHEEDAA